MVAPNKSQHIDIHMNCLVVGSTCILVLLQHVGAAVFSSYSTRTATKSGGFSQLLSVPPMSASRLHNLRKRGQYNKLSSGHSTCLQYMSILETHWLALYSNTSACSAWWVQQRAFYMSPVYEYTRNALAGFILKHFCMLCLVGTTAGILHVSSI